MENQNKIVTYYQPRDERLPEYYFEHIKLLGLDKQPFGLDHNGTIRFEQKDTNSKIWQDTRHLAILKMVLEIIINYTLITRRVNILLKILCSFTVKMAVL